MSVQTIQKPLGKNSIISVQMDRELSQGNLVTHFNVNDKQWNKILKIIDENTNSGCFDLFYFNKQDAMILESEKYLEDRAKNATD
jgi:hypothetical protein